MKNLNFKIKCIKLFKFYRMNFLIAYIFLHNFQIQDANIQDYRLKAIKKKLNPNHHISNKTVNLESLNIT